MVEIIFRRDGRTPISQQHFGNIFSSSHLDVTDH